MLPASICHSGMEYDVRHLAQRFLSFSWQGRDGTDFQFSVRVRYSDHCISATPSLSLPPDAFVFEAPASMRVFDVDRYNWSLELPSIVETLFVRPTTSIQLTREQNGYVFRLTMKHPLNTGEKYFCFLRLKRSPEYVAGASPLKLDLFVESAYARSTDPIRSTQRLMFGRLAESLVK
jgi:hypothetical protein